MLMSMRPGFEARAMLPNWLLMLCTMREAVVKSGLESDSESLPSCPRSSSTLRSTMAPFGVVPTVGKFFCAVLPLPPVMKPPVETGPCATA